MSRRKFSRAQKKINENKKLISHRRAVQRPCLMSKFSRIFCENKNLTQHAQEVEKLVAKKLVEEKEENSINRKPSEISSLIKLQKAACSLTVKNSISFISSSCYVTLYVLYVQFSKHQEKC